MPGVLAVIFVGLGNARPDHGGRMEMAMPRRGKGIEQRCGDERQQADMGGRRRRAIIPVPMPAREQIFHRRRRAVIAIVEHHIGPVDIDLLTLNRRRHVEVVDFKTFRRVQSGAQKGEATARVRGVRAAGIAAQIGPIGSRRIGLDGAPPGQGFAAQGQHDARAPGVSRVGIGVQKILIGVDCVDFDRHIEGLGDGIIADRPGAQIGRRLESHGGRARRAGEEDRRRREFGLVPGNLRAACLLRNAQAGAGESLVERKAALAQHFGERLGVNAVGAFCGGRHGAGRGVEGVKRAGRRFDQREAAGERRTAAREIIHPRRVEDDDARPQRRLRQRAEIVAQAHRFKRRGSGVGNCGVDGREKIMALELEAAAGEIDENRRVRSGGDRFFDEFAQGLAQAVLVEVGGAGDVETGALQSVGDQAGVIGGGGERIGLIGRFADDQGEARRVVRRRLGRRGGRPCDKRGESESARREP